MSLQVWLPLNGDIKNQGLYNIESINNTGFTIDNFGKIGKCYLTNSKKLEFNFLDLSSSSWSLATWFYPTSSSSSGHQYIISLNTSTANDFTGTLCFYADKICARIGGTTYQGDTVTLNTWNHGVITYDCNKKVLKIYHNGNLVLTQNNPVTPVAATKVFIGVRGTAVGAFAGKLNDIRIYNHALSVKEVKELSKGLILHYLLNDSNIGNLIINGNGNLGNYNWSKSPDTTNIPNITGIEGSFSDAITSEYIHFSPLHTYSLQMYLKTTGATSGNTYPSFRVYDHDKKEILNFHCASGFDSATVTTLTQPLNPGDTIIHAANLSNWRTDTTSYYYYVAVFGYQNSDGYIYPDLEYTRDSLVFGTRADKSNINKTNNTITLKSAYTGVARPAGTTICQATAGSTYNYPFGSIALSSISDWTFKSTTFGYQTGNDWKRRSSAEYIRFYAYSGAYYAGIELRDLTYKSNVIYDCSGYCHTGLSNHIDTTTDSPRYEKSSIFIARGTDVTNSSWIKINDNNWMAQGMEEITINLWAYSSDWTTRPKLFSCTESGGFNTENGNSGYIRFPVHVYTDAEKTSVAYKYSSKEIKVSDLVAGWHMFTFIVNSTGNKVYIDGNLHSSYDYVNYGIHYNLNARLFLGCEASGASASQPFLTGRISDFRIYCTILSNDDIKELYNIPAQIDKAGNLYTYEYKEV